MATRREILDPRGDIVLRLRSKTKPIEMMEPVERERKRYPFPAIDYSDSDSDSSSEMGQPHTPRASGISAKIPAQGAVRVPESVWETVEVVVASKILCLISPVFEALLTGPFRESRELANTTLLNRGNTSDAARHLSSAGSSIIGGPAATAKANVDALYKLELPEDDAEAMIVFMRFAHYRPSLGFSRENSNGQAAVPGTILLEKLAVLGDKYQCMVVLNALCTGWAQTNWDILRSACPRPLLSKSHFVQNASQLANYTSSCYRLLVFCAVADVPTVFSDICSDIVNHHKGPITSLMADFLDGPTEGIEELNHRLLPGALPAFLETTRRERLEWLQRTLFAPALSSRRLTTCENEHLDAAIYLRRIKAAKLAPQEGLYACESLYGYFELARTTLDKVPMTSLPQFDNYYERTCSCIAFKKAVKSAARLIRKTCLNHTICLDCIRSDGRSKKQGVCQIAHSAYPCYGGS